MGLDYHLERKLRFKVNDEHTSLYSWSIVEIDDKSEQVGIDQIPWHWSLYFTATEIVLQDSIELRTYGHAEDPEQPPDEVKVGRVIRATLRPGDERGDKHWYQRTTFKMFGTDRELKDFNLAVRALASEDEQEGCTAWGVVSYDSGDDFHPQTYGDSIGFDLFVKPSTFDRYAGRITSGSADELVFSVGAVSGFYSEWSPDIYTRDVKVLATGDQQLIDFPPEATGVVPRLHEVGEAHLYINAKRTQQKQMKPVDADDDDEPEVVSLGRPEFAQSSAPATDPKLTASLRTAGRWIIGLLVVLIIVTLWRR